MKIISTKTHGVLDYVLGVFLIASPWIFGFADNNTAKWIPIILGVSALLYSLLTDYELGMARMISMKTHLSLDTFSGIFLAASPWIFGFAGDVYLPHLILGILEIGAAAMTNSGSATSNGNIRSSHAL